MFRTQYGNSIIIGFYCIAFIKYMTARKALLDYINFFSPLGYKMNEKIVYKNFKDKYDKMKLKFLTLD